jgi:hypothetical protein
MPRKKYDEWISAKEALADFKKSNGGAKALKETIAEHLRDGDLRARGRLYRQVPGEQISNAWKKIKGQPLPDIEEISRSKFRASKPWHKDVSQWRWPLNKFSITYTTRGRKKYRSLISDVELNMADLRKLLNPPAPLKTGGQEINLETWTDFMCASIQAALDGKLDPTVTKDQTELLEIISERMQGEEFGDKTMKKAVAEIWERFIEPTREERLIQEGAKVR